MCDARPPYWCSRQLQRATELVRSAYSERNAYATRGDRLTRIRAIRAERIRERGKTSVSGKMIFEGAASPRDLLLLRGYTERGKIGMRGRVIAKSDSDST